MRASLEGLWKRQNIFLFHIFRSPCEFLSLLLSSSPIPLVVSHTFPCRQLFVRTTSQKPATERPYLGALKSSLHIRSYIFLCIYGHFKELLRRDCGRGKSTERGASKAVVQCSPWCLSPDLQCYGQRSLGIQSTRRCMLNWQLLPGICN